jgi:peptidyl-prolyl cis-trans isomerase SurA
MTKLISYRWIIGLGIAVGLGLCWLPQLGLAQDQSQGLSLGQDQSQDPAQGGSDELKIAAVVNDELITQLDVLMRLRIALLSAKLPDTPEVEHRLLPQVVRQLIDEHLKRQEAKKESITVTQAEVDEQLDHIAQRNGLTRDQMQAQLSSAGVLMSALAEQVQADMSWVRLVQTKLRSSVHITDEEINEEIARIQETRGQTEYRLSGIFLASDNPSQNDAVANSANRLMEQLQAGADFNPILPGSVGCPRR